MGKTEALHYGPAAHSPSGVSVPETMKERRVTVRGTEMVFLGLRGKLSGFKAAHSLLMEPHALMQGGPYYGAEIKGFWCRNGWDC